MQEFRIRMTLGVLVPLLACAGACALAGAVLARAPSRAVARLVVAALAALLAWAGLQLAWSRVVDAHTALRLMRCGAVGMLLGPLALHLFLEVNPAYASRLRGLLRLAYASVLALVVLEIATPWILVDAVRVPWGWVYDPGPGFAAAYAVTAGCVGIAWWIVLRGRPPDAQPRSRRARLVGGLLIAVPLGVGTVTDFVLPMLGIQVPLLGSLCLVTIAALSWLAARPLGYWVLSARTFATEILETLPDGVALMRADRCIRTANGRLAQLLSLPRRDAIGCCLDEYLPDPLPEASTRGIERETLLRLPTGRAVPVSVTTRQLADRQGEPIGQVLVMRDRRELADLRARLVTSARMAAVGELAAGIAHEVNNPIAFIQSNLNLLGRHLGCVGDRLAKARPHGAPPATERAERLVADAHAEVERIASIVREVRGFAHAGPSGHVIAELGELVESAACVAAPLLRDHVTLEREYDSLPPIVCAPQQLKQLFLTLIVAAVRAPGPPQTVRLRTERRRGAAWVGLECPPGSRADALARIFDPVAVAPADPSLVGDASLAVCEHIAARHGGGLGVETLPGGGCRVWVRLRLDEEPSVTRGDAA